MKNVFNVHIYIYKGRVTFSCLILVLNKICNTKCHSEKLKQYPNIIVKMYGLIVFSGLFIMTAAGLMFHC